MDERQKPKGADASTDRIVERIRAEGQLTRNTGTNSIKSINVNLTKFQGVFQSMNSNMIEQTSLMRQNIALVTEENERLRRMEEMARVTPTGGNGNGNGGGRNNNPTPEPNTKNKFNFGMLGDWGRAGLAGGIGGLIGAGGLNTIRAGLLAAAAPLIGDYLGEFASLALKSEGFGNAAATTFGDAVNMGAMWAMFGAIFGKKTAIVAGSAAFLSSFSDELSNALGIDAETMQKDFFMGFTGDQVLQGVLGGIGVGVTTFMMSKKFKDMLGSAVSTALLSSKNGISMAGKLVGLPGIVAAAVGGLYWMYGDDAKAYLEGQGMGSDWADVSVDAAAYGLGGAMTLGRMFGPYGFIAGAVGGVAFAIGSKILEKMRNMNNAIKDHAFKELDEVEKAIKDGNATPEEVQAAVAKAKTEARRDSQLARNAEELEAARDGERRARDVSLSAVQNKEFDKNTAQDLVMKLVDDMKLGAAKNLEESEAEISKLVERLIREGVDTKEEMNHAFFAIERKLGANIMYGAAVGDARDSIDDMNFDVAPQPQIRPRARPEFNVNPESEINRPMMMSRNSANITQAEALSQRLSNYLDFLEAGSQQTSNNINMMPIFSNPVTNVHGGTQNNVNSSNFVGVGGVGGGSSLDLPGNVS